MTITPATPRPEAESAARAFVADHFPDASVVILAGSAASGRATATSDLDLVLLTQRLVAPYRETFHAHGWPIEAFVYTPSTYQHWFEQDRQRRRPSLPTMCATGIVLEDGAGLAARLQQDARTLLEAGPGALTATELANARYRVTDLVQDLESARADEAHFVIATLVPALADLICDTIGNWRGEGKWALRAVRHADPEIAERLVVALNEAARAGNVGPLVAVTEAALKRVGGRLFAGYSAGK